MNGGVFKEGRRIKSSVLCTYYTIVCLTCKTEFTDIYTVISFMKANNWDCGESLENEVHPKFTKIIEQETQKIVSTSINNETKLLFNQNLLEQIYMPKDESE